MTDDGDRPVQRLANWWRLRKCRRGEHDYGYDTVPMAGKRWYVCRRVCGERVEAMLPIEEDGWLTEYGRRILAEMERLERPGVSR